MNHQQILIDLEFDDSECFLSVVYNIYLYAQFNRIIYPITNKQTATTEADTRSIVYLVFEFINNPRFFFQTADQNIWITNIHTHTYIPDVSTNRNDILTFEKKQNEKKPCPKT